METRIKQLRESRGMSQTALAELVGSTQQSLCRYENGKTAPPADVIVAIAKYFQVSTDYVLCCSNSMMNMDMQEQAKHDYELMYREISMLKRLSEQKRRLVMMMMEELEGV
ncbi:MAG: helix-turn-helix transcriptional regulator [Eubacteriales bacterium]|nr:helix-turn-helix transcriptional regulator [Eubacteriales bacterium]